EQTRGRAFHEQLLQWAIIEGEDVVTPGLPPPQLLELLEPFGFGLGEIAALGEIRAGVVQPPLVLLVGDSRRVRGDGLPAVIPHRAVAEGLPVLRAPAR